MSRSGIIRGIILGIPRSIILRQQPRPRYRNSDGTDRRRQDDSQDGHGQDNTSPLPLARRVRRVERDGADGCLHRRLGQPGERHEEALLRLQRKAAHGVRRGREAEGARDDNERHTEARVPSPDDRQIYCRPQQREEERLGHARPQLAEDAPGGLI